MASGQSGTIVRQVQRLFGGGSVAGLGEGQLLERFIKNRDASALEAIIARHGPMVLGVCRRVLHDPRDAEDAFQVTFLILVKKAGGIRDRERLGPWLHGVAQRVALRARFVAARSLERERTGVELEETAVESLGETDRREFRAVLDEELGRLPVKYRSPIVLCYLEGLTHEEAAERLRWPWSSRPSAAARGLGQGTMGGRLARRGLALPSALLLSALASETSAAPVPPALLESTLRAAMGLAVAKGATAGIVSASVASLMGETLNVMYFHKLKSFAFAMLAVGAVTGGAVIANLEPAPRQSSTPNDSNAAAGARADDDDQLAEINAEIKNLEDRLKSARKRRQEILAARGRGRTGGSGSTSHVTTSGTTGNPSNATTTSGSGVGQPAGSGVISGTTGASTSSDPGFTIATGGAPNGFSVSASSSARSSSSSSGQSNSSSFGTSSRGGKAGGTSTGAPSTGTDGSSRTGSNSSSATSSKSSISGSVSTTNGPTPGGTSTTAGSLTGAPDGAGFPFGKEGFRFRASSGSVTAVVTPDGSRVAVHRVGGGHQGLPRSHGAPRYAVGLGRVRHAARRGRIDSRGRRLRRGA